MQKKILIIGVYAPPAGDNPDFFTDEVFPILDNVEHDHVVLGGDWNLGMDSDLDYEGYTRADQVRPKSRHILHKQIDKYEVYRRLARHSPRAEANYAIQYNTVPCNTIYKVMKYTKYHL